MNNMLKKIFFWVYIKIHSLILYISIALYNTENELLKANPNDLNNSNEKNQRNLHRNPLLEKFYAGQKDEKYVQDYYELLRKADLFLKKSTPSKIEMASHMNGTNFGMKDKYGRRYEHYGFFDSKHKNSGKTLREVLELEYEERRTKDDDYPLEYLFNNMPIEVSLSKVFDAVNDKNIVIDREEKSKSIQFPIKCHRDDDVVNKIEHLAEFLHVKRIDDEVKILEFFIPLKYGTEKVKENSKIYEDITKINSIFVKDDYGTLIGFKINNFRKRIKINDTYEVWKFNGCQMQNVN